MATRYLFLGHLRYNQYLEEYVFFQTLNFVYHHDDRTDNRTVQQSHYLSF